MKEPTKDVAILMKQLKSVGKEMSDRRGLPKSWPAIWMGMVGACYSLYKAKPLLEASREFRLQVDHARLLLDHIETGEKACSIEVDLKPWFVGYHLNNAELRISSVLHRLLKTYHDKNKDAFPLIEATVTKCPICGEHPIKVSPRIVSVLREWNSEGKKLSSRTYIYSDRSSGASLRRVWHRVNTLKHSPLPRPDMENPERRWQDVHSSLSGLLLIFIDFAKIKGLL